MTTVYASMPAPHAVHSAGSWLARRWYYTPKSRRAYSVRQIAPGDRRLLAEFALGLEPPKGVNPPEADDVSLRELSALLFDRVLAGGNEMAAGFVALESTAAGDRVIGVAAYAPGTGDDAAFSVAVAEGFRDEQVGSILLSTLVRHAKRVGIRRVRADMFWSNRAMRRLAHSMGFAIETAPGDRLYRSLILTLK